MIITSISCVGSKLEKLRFLELAYRHARAAAKFTQLLKVNEEGEHCTGEIYLATMCQDFFSALYFQCT